MPDLFLFAPAAAGESTIGALLGALAALLIAARLLGDLAQRLGQPAVLGELVAGIVLGPSVLHVLDPDQAVIHTLGELGVLILLFQIGLHTSLGAILRVGGPAAAVGLVGVAFPFAGGYLASMALGLGGITAVVCGAALTATSIGISARVLSDIGQLETDEGRIVLGAAVLDDVVGLVILSVVSGLAAGGAITTGGVAWTAVLALGFVAVSLVLGRLAAPRLMAWVGRSPGSGAQGALALALAFALAAAAATVGSATIIGAFTAGLVIHPTPQAKAIEKAATTLGHFFVPIFFAVVGASIDLGSLADARVLLIGGVLCAVAVAGKLLAGYAPVWFRGHKLLIGVAMVPRGEVGLIFAQMGLSTGALDDGLFSAVVLMVMVTTFIAPPWLAALGKGAEGPADESGLDELVYGEDEPAPSP